MPPTALIESIAAVRRRVRTLSVLYGVGVVVASAVGLLFALVTIDWLLNLYAVPRVVAMAAAIAAAGYAAWQWVARPATTELPLTDVAGRLERAFPQFEDRLRSTIDFSQSANPGSAVLQQRTIDQAARLAADLNLGSAVVARPAVVSLAGAAGAVVVLMLLAGVVLDRGTLGVIASRLLTPFNAKAWPKRVQIDAGPGLPSRVPVGQKIDVRVTLARGDKPSMRPVLYYQFDGGPVQQVFMTRDGDGFRSSLDARLDPGQTAGTVKAWVEAGDDRRDLSAVTVVPRLTVRKIEAAVTPPPYAPARATPPQDLAVATAVAAEGGRVSVRVQFNKPLSSADPVLEPVAAPAATQLSTRPASLPTWSRPADGVAVATFAADAGRRFRVRATDVDGFTNTALEEYEIVVRPDTNLSIQLESPRRSEERTAAAFVPLQAVVEDDNGVADVALQIERLSPSPKTWRLPLLDAAKPMPAVKWQSVDATAERVRHRLNHQWELASLQLKDGDVVEYGVVARDNYDLGGRRHAWVGTGKQRITIVSQDDLASRVTDELRGIKSQAGLVRTTQQRAKQDTQQLGDDTKDKEKLDAGDQAVAGRLTQQQASAAAAAKQLSERVQQSLDRLDENRSPADTLKDTAADVRNTLAQAGEGPMKSAADDLAAAARPERKADERGGDLDQAKADQQKALAQLDRAIQKLDSVGSLQGSIAEVAAILAEQKRLREANEEFAKTNLGKRPQDLADAEKKKLDATSDQQSKLADRTQKALEKMAEQGKQMQKSDPSSAEAMASAAKKGEQSKVSQDQKRAAQQTQQNQQANAQQTQKQAELGLETVLNELKEAERRELARLREQLAKLQEQVAALVRRQSGHNLDNLLIQGSDKLKTAGEPLVAKLAGDAKRPPADLKAPEPRLLTSGQELTGRNARDLAAATDASPQTANVGAQLGKAAGQMERAVVGLRATKVADAYDPHQVEALAALVEAQKQVDQQKADADKKQEDQQKDAIRERYVKIKARQEAINADTQRVEKSRDAAGNPPRTEWPALARMPKAQGDLAADTNKIEEDLQALGSIVYVWANRDIKQAMDGVQTDLADKKTAVATQAEQDRVVEQLAAMIKNLKAEPPPEKKFEAGGGGGGGGQCPPPKMPTVAELKLLKDFQAAVNGSTAKIAAAPERDAPRLVSLGGRQGDLRNLLDNLLKKSKGDDGGLGPEPDNKDQLPEEATDADVEQKDLTDTLLGDDPEKNQQKIDKDFANVGTRMARSRQRLAINTDPGQVTQKIQKRILFDLDDLIEQAKKNAQQQQAGSQPKPGQKPPKPGEQQQANNEGKNQQASKPGGKGEATKNSAAAGSKPNNLKDLTESAAEWGKVTPRVRDAVIDSRGEAIVEQYRKLIEDYYGALGNQGGKKQ